jgi:dephospho-CoA kinase
MMIYCQEKYAKMSRNMKKKIIGLTGPIAAGKNEAAKILKRAGAYIIDADEIGHCLLAREPAVGKKALKTFGTKDRKKIGKVVFSDRAKLKTINNIIHPAIKAEIKKEIRRRKTGLVIVNAALPELFRGMVGLTIVVMASEEKRVLRLVNSGLPRAEALKRIAAQRTAEDYLKIADKVILNNGTLKELVKKVNMV